VVVGISSSLVVRLEGPSRLSRPVYLPLMKLLNRLSTLRWLMLPDEMEKLWPMADALRLM
jgi:hypothetical protein